jgi:ankyrin repeat protein
MDRGADINGFTPLHQACQHGNTATALALIDRGADMRSKMYARLTFFKESMDICTGPSSVSDGRQWTRVEDKQR